MKIIDYNFTATNVANPDGSLSAQAANCTVVTGPGAIASGNFPKALDFGTNGKIQVTLIPAAIKTERFCVRVVFKVDAAVTARQNIVESNCLPFAMFLDKTATAGVFKITTTVAPTGYGWAGASSEFFKDLKTGTWYTADLVYDTDTVAVFIDGILLSVHAFPTGIIPKNTTNQLMIGKSMDGTKYQFNGKLAAVQWYNDEIPADLELQLDDRRSQPEWFLTHKYEATKNDLVISIGLPVGKYVYDVNASAYIQVCEAGLIMYSQNNGAAFEMHGAIYQLYKTLTNKADFGYLVSDETKTTKAGGRKNLFSKGGIYWSSATGAVAVTGQLYIDYERLGESSVIGWPLSAATGITNGKEQAFQNGKMFHKNGTPKAYEVHGSILAKFTVSGGIAKWGYPVSNESDVKNGTLVIGKSSEFEGCTVYFKEGVGAFEVHGEIRTKYKDVKGPAGQLGFPTSDETDIPGVAGAKYNSFQNGTITWFGSASKTFACGPFNIFLGRIETKETEGAFMGSNDTYFTASIEENGKEIFSQKFGESENQNIRKVEKVIGPAFVPNDPGKKIKFKLDVWDADPGDDDHLGVFTSEELNLANAWGMLNGPFTGAKIDKINSVTWSVNPVPNPNLKTWEKWWGVQNQKSLNKATWVQYATAFRDVDSETEDWDVTDWLQKLWYEAFVAERPLGGNCFGMSLEAIYAYKNRSVLGLPLNRFTDWSKTENEFNIKHIYQVGADMVYWMAGQILSGNTHNPVDVFNASHAEFLRGCDPVICISQNWNFTGGPHCILPIAWDKSTKPWKMSILDSNFPSSANSSDAQVIRTLFVDPDKNEFTYEGGKSYKGGQWSGGRLHYTPFSILGHRQYTPIADPIAMTIAALALIFGADTESVSLVDENGVDLDATGADSTNLLKQGKPLTNKFVSFRGFYGDDQPAPHVFIRPEALNPQFEPEKAGMFRSSEVAGLTLSELLKDAALTQSISAIKTHVQYNAIKDRTLTSIVSDTKLMTALGAGLAQPLTMINNKYSSEKKFKHQVRGTKNGQLKYSVKDKLNAVKFESTIKTGEVNTFESKNVGGTAVMKMISPEAKTVRLEISNKFGSGKDNVNIIIDKIPVASGKDIQLSIKPGLGGLDLLTTAPKTTASISIQMTVGGFTTSKTFSLDIEGGMRISPASMLTGNKLKVGKIDAMSGPAKSFNMIAGK